MIDDWALCVGIGAYGKDAKLDPLPGALNDAGAIHGWLTDPQGGDVPSRQAKLLVSPRRQPEHGEPSPRAWEIEDFLRGLVRRAEHSARVGDGFRVGRRLWLYYSGHGLGFTPESDTGLLVADAHPRSDLPHIAGRAWAEVFRASGAFEQVVLLMDCCRTEAVRTPLQQPSVRTALADPGGKMVAAFAVAPNESAFETVVDHRARGRFTLALERLLKDPDSANTTAREFLQRLEHAYPAVDPFPPRRARDDFVLVENAPEASSGAPPHLLIAHDESSTQLATDLARKLVTPQRRAHAQSGDAVMRASAERYRDIDTLVVTQELGRRAMQRLIGHVRPDRTVVFNRTDPGLQSAEAVRFIPRPPNVSSIDTLAPRIEAALKVLLQTHTVAAQEPIARVQVWDSRGRQVAEGLGSVELTAVRPGGYLGRASVGPAYSQTSFRAVAGAANHTRLDPLPLPEPGPERAVRPRKLSTLDDGRDETTFTSSTGVSAELSLPNTPGWRTEVFIHPPSLGSGLSVRMVPQSHERWAPHPADRTREALRLALQQRRGPIPHLSADMFTNDPIGCLLAAALQARSGGDPSGCLSTAARILGEDDLDVRLLRGERVEVSSPPLLVASWERGIAAGTMTIVPGSRADSLTGRVLEAPPWLGWSPQPSDEQPRWLDRVAFALWPGWDSVPDPAAVRGGLRSVATSFATTPDSFVRRAYKSPPIDRLVHHERIEFVGATNDQLPAALAIAFAERGGRPWDRLKIWSQRDQALLRRQASQHQSASPLPARDRAESRLTALLPTVTEHGSLHRYDQFVVDGQPGYASLWDWEGPGGIVHWSPVDDAQCIRTAPSEDLRWSASSPPDLYTRVVDAWARLGAQTPQL